MKVVLLVLIAVGGLVWWLGARRVARLLGVPARWTGRRGQIAFFTVIVAALLAVSLLPYLNG